MTHHLIFMVEGWTTKGSGTPDLVRKLRRQIGPGELEESDGSPLLLEGKRKKPAVWFIEPGPQSDSEN
jgi:hypothetical protein